MTRNTLTRISAAFLLVALAALSAQAADGSAVEPVASLPAYLPGCGLPSLVAAVNVAQGCYQGSNHIPFSNPGGENTLLLVRIENGTKANPAFITYAGVNLKLLRQDPGYAGRLLSYYLVNPTPGENALDVNYAQGGCSWNVVAELYSGVNQASPIGSSSSGKGKSDTIQTRLKTSGAASLISDFLAIENVTGIQGLDLGSGQESFDLSTGCCEEVFGDDKPVGGAGMQVMTYKLGQMKSFASQLVEIQGAAACGTPTPSLSPSPVAGCNPPSLVFSKNVAKGCIAQKETQIKIKIAQGPNLLLLVRIEAGSGAADLLDAAAVSFAGRPMTRFISDEAYNGTKLQTYYQANPAVGAEPLLIKLEDTGCNWNVVAELFQDAKQSQPLGAHSTQTGKDVPNFITKLNTQGKNSALDDFLDVSNVVSGHVGVGLGLGQKSHQFSSGCCEEIFGDWKPVNGPSGPQVMTYALDQNKSYTSQLIEILAAPCKP